MNRRNFFRMLTGSAVAALLPWKLALPETAKPARIFADELKQIERDFPGVKVFDCHGQSVFPVFSETGNLCAVMAAYLYVGKCFQGATLCRPGTKGMACEAAFQVFRHSVGAYASVEWTKPVDDQDVLRLLRRAAFALVNPNGPQWEVTSPWTSLSGLHYYQTVVAE